MAKAREPEKLKVFISYSRRSLQFVDRLQSALKARGIDAAVDRTEIEKGEAWWKRIEQLVIEADAVIFVLSPASVNSKICLDEVEFAEKLRKRIVPIVAEDVFGLKVPDALGRLNYVFFISNAAAGATGEFELALNDLVRALETDIGWIREHTRIGAIAQRWMGSSAGGGHDLLLRGAELEAAERWMAGRPVKAPDLGDAHIAFLAESRKAATRRQRWTVGISVAVAIAAVSLAGLAYFQRTIAVRQSQAAKEALQEAQKNETLRLSESSKEILNKDALMAMLLALEGMPDATAGIDRPEVADASVQLDQAVRKTKELARLVHDGEVNLVVFSPDRELLATASEDKTARLFETATHKELAQFSHDGPVRSVVFSPNNRLLATGSDDKTARLYETATGKEVARFSHDGNVLDVAFSQDGRWLATGSWHNFPRSGGEARLYETATGKELARFPHDGPVRSVVFSPNGLLLATVSDDKTARLYETATGKELARFSHEGPVRSVVFSPNGQLLATASEDKTARLYETATGKEQAQFSHDGPVTAVAFSPNGQLLATASEDMTARVYEAFTGKDLFKLAQESPVHDVAFSPDGKIVAIASGSIERGRFGAIMGGSGEVRLVVAATGEEQARFPHDGPVATVAYSPDGKLIATTWGLDISDMISYGIETAGVRGEARLYDTAPGMELARVPHRGEVHEVAFSPDGTLLATGAYGETIYIGETRLVEAATGKERMARQSHSGRVTSVAFLLEGRVIVAVSDTVSRYETATGKEIMALSQAGSRPVREVAFSVDGRYLATTFLDSHIQITDPVTGKELSRLTHEGTVLVVAFSQDGRWLATGSWDKSSTSRGEARLYEIATGKEVARFSHDGPVRSVVFSPNGLLLATASDDKTARLYETATGKELTRFFHDGPVSSVVFSPNDQLLATASEDKTARLFETATGKELARLPHNDRVKLVKFAPNGQLLATASEDKTARLYETATGKEQAQFSHDGPVTAVAFSPNGQLLATASEDMTARLWRIWPTTEELVNAAKARAGRCLTQQQRKRYFLPPNPPIWCIERRLWPYQSEKWQTWLLKRKAWIAASGQGAEPERPKAD